MITIYYQPPGDTEYYGDEATDEIMDALDILECDYIESMGYNVVLGPRTDNDPVLDYWYAAGDIEQLWQNVWAYAVQHFRAGEHESIDEFTNIDPLGISRIVFTWSPPGNPSCYGETINPDDMSTIDALIIGYIQKWAMTFALSRAQMMTNVSTGGMNPVTTCGTCRTRRRITHLGISRLKNRIRNLEGRWSSELWSS